MPLSGKIKHKKWRTGVLNNQSSLEMQCCNAQGRTLEANILAHFFFFLATTMAYGSSRPGIKSESQLQQCQILNPVHHSGNSSGNICFNKVIPMLRFENNRYNLFSCLKTVRFFVILGFNFSSIKIFHRFADAHNHT